MSHLHEDTWKTPRLLSGRLPRWRRAEKKIKTENWTTEVVCFLVVLQLRQYRVFLLLLLVTEQPTFIIQPRGEKPNPVHSDFLLLTVQGNKTSSLSGGQWAESPKGGRSELLLVRILL